MKKYMKSGKMARRISVVMALLLTAGAAQWTIGAATEEPADQIVIEDTAEEVETEVSEDTAEEVETETADVKLNDEFCNAAANFSLNLMKELLKENENRLISGESVSEALAVVASGAQGETREELEQTLMGGMDTETYQKLLAAFHKNLSENAWSTFSTADGIWLNENQGISLLDDFVSQNQENFGAAVQAAPFNEDTLKEINDWVSEHTNGMIPQMLDHLSEDEIIHILNATVFEGEWVDPFYRVQEGTFTDASGQEQKADMMYSTEERYIELGNGVGFVKDYVGGQFTFVGILPEEGTSLTDYLADLTGEEFLSAYQNAKSDKIVEVQLPKFTFDDTTMMKDALEAMGIKKAFSEEADFSLMTEANLSVDQILHKTHIEVDENGTKAAAATDVAIKATAAFDEETKEILEIKLDRPYFYAIVNTETGIPLFFGAQNTME
ncbi:MAG: serpin family protein [Eubacteriales bacterium]|nr:serpin family protein [Eubacteriales bacterium]